MGDFSFPAQPPGQPGFPGNANPITFDVFKGLNTKPSRPALEDGQCYILDNWMPFGKSNARTMWGIGAAIYTAPTGKTILFYGFYNISDSAYCAVFLSDGSVQQVSSSLAVVQIAPPGTIQNPANQNGFAQWGSQYLLFSAAQTNGYWVWDGAVLYSAGTTGPDVVFGQSGLDYDTVIPAVAAYGGAGSGFAGMATILNGSVTKITVTNPGHGYGENDAVILTFSATSENPNFTATANVTIASGALTAVTPNSLGLGYTAAATAVVLGGGGTGATVTLTVSAGQVTAYTVSDGGIGYVSNPTIYIVDPGNTVAAAQIDMMPFGVSGTAIETYSGIVWVSNGKAPTSSPPKSRVLFSAPDSVSDFGAPDGGGSFVSMDSFLRVGYQAMRQTNGFLYLIGDSSLNTISGVSTSTAGDVATTTFINQNQDPQIGSPWPNSVQVFSRNVVFANPFGIHVSYGGAVAKVSDALDGFYTSVPAVQTSAVSPSSAVAVIFGIHVYMLLLPIIDQVTGIQTNKLLMWDGQNFWTANQEIPLTFISSQEINSVMTTYGTDGTSIYPLFQNPSVSILKTIQSKLWDNPGYWFTKTVNRLFGLVNYYNSLDSNLFVDIDNINNTPDSITVTLTPNGLSWTNNVDGPISWTNNLGDAISWGSPNGIVVFPPIAASQNGPLIGLTMQTNCADMALLSLGFLEENYSANI